MIKSRLCKTLFMAIIFLGIIFIAQESMAVSCPSCHQSAAIGTYNSNQHRIDCANHPNGGLQTWVNHNYSASVCVCSVCGYCPYWPIHNYSTATCTEASKCTRCGYKNSDALGHSWVAATCTAPKTCSRCNATEGSALGHTGGTATCTKGKICTRCGAEYGSALGHTGGTATCTKGPVCARCGAEYGSALGHNWAAATCTTAKKCSRCNATEGSALGHTGGTATCTKGKICTRCSTEYGSALGHDYSVPATCTTAKKCSRCTSTTGSALGHNWSGPTCTTAAVCTRCSATGDAALGHNWIPSGCASYCSRCYAVTGGHTPSSTYTSDGTYHWKNCTVCGQVATNKEYHTGGTATCTAAATCTVCSASYGNLAAHTPSSTYTTDTNQHWKVCTVCGGIAVAKANHTAASTYTTNATQHWKVCTVCSRTVVAKANHTGGTATCQVKAICSTCNTAYGNNASHSYTEATSCSNIMKCQWCNATQGSHVASSAYSTDDDYHWKVCSRGCGTIVVAKAAHNWNVTTCGKNCTVCQKAIGSHTPNSEYTSDADYHWIECSRCAAITTPKASHTVTDNGIRRYCNVCNHTLATKGSTAVYEKYGIGIYKEYSCINQMTTSANAITLPTKSGYTFNGYYTLETGGVKLIDQYGKITAAFLANYFNKTNTPATLYAQWTVNTYTVTYNANGGSGAPSAQTKTHGVGLTLSSTIPTKSNYAFMGWNTAQNGSGVVYQAGDTYSANSPVTLYAQWGQPCTVTAQTYTNGASSTAGGSWTGAGTYSSGATVTITATPNAGYRFAGWEQPSGTQVLADANAATTTFTITGNTTIRAKFMQQATLTLLVQTNRDDNNTAGGTVSGAGTYDICSQVTITATANPGYTFYDWEVGTTTNTNTSWTITVNSDMTIGAAFLQTYTVTYNANGGSGAPGNQTKTYGTNLTLSSTVPTRSGYLFTGWNTASNGSETGYAPGGTYTTNAAATLYAQWIAPITPALGSYIAYNSGTDYTGKWRVLRTNDGTIEIVSAQSVSDVTLIGKDGYANGVKILNDQSAAYVNPTYADRGRSLGGTYDSIEQLDTNAYPLEYSNEYSLGYPYRDSNNTYDDQALQTTGIVFDKDVWLASRDDGWQQNGMYGCPSKSYHMRYRYTYSGYGNSNAYTLYFRYYNYQNSQNPYEEAGLTVTKGLCPVISLKSNVYISGGSGTEDNPYTLSVAPATTSIPVGSYVSYSGGSYTGKWVVFKNNPGEIEIISASSVRDKTFTGSSDYISAVSQLNYIVNNYVNSTYAVSGRSLGASSNSISQINTSQNPITYSGLNANQGLPYIDNYCEDDVIALSKIPTMCNMVNESSKIVWVASRYATMSSDAEFGVRYVNIHNSSYSLEGRYYNTAGCMIYRVYSNEASYDYSYTYGILPVIKLKPNICVTGGNGTAGDPYTIGI